MGHFVAVFFLKNWLGLVFHLTDQGTTSLQSHSMAVSNPGFCQPLNFLRKLIITARNEVVAKVMLLLGADPPGADTLPPGPDTPQEQNPPSAGKQTPA